MSRCWKMMTQYCRVAAALCAYSFTIAAPAHADGLLSRFFEPSHVSIQKEACEKSLKSELEFRSSGTKAQSGYLIPDIFDTSLTFASEEKVEIEYRYDLYAEGAWHLVLEDDPDRKGRYSDNQRIVDAYRVVSLGILTEAEAAPTWASFMENENGKQRAFRGIGTCRFLSQQSKTPSFVHIMASSR